MSNIIDVKSESAKSKKMSKIARSEILPEGVDLLSLKDAARVGAAQKCDGIGSVGNHRTSKTHPV